MQEIYIIKEDEMYYWVKYNGQDTYMLDTLQKLSQSNRELKIYKNEYHYIPIVYNLIKKPSFILAIDGMCGAGKSTLAKRLGHIFQANIFCMDDFYLPFAKRVLQPGGHMDYERLKESILIPLNQHQDISYQKFDCRLQTYHNPQNICYQPYNIIEGSYSLHPKLESYYTDQLVLKISEEMQKQRIYQRNPERYNDFINQWIPLENNYFKYYHIFERYLVID